MDCEDLLSKAQQDNEAAYDLLRLCALCDLHAPIPLWAFQHFSPYVELPKLPWMICEEIQMRHAVAYLQDQHVSSEKEIDAKAHNLVFSSDSCNIDDLKQTLGRRFLSGDAAIELMQQFIIFYHAAYPQFDKHDLLWTPAKLLAPHLAFLLNMIWNDWREKVPHLIDENYALCCCALASHSVSMAKFEHAEALFSRLSEISTTYPDANTPRVQVFGKLGQALLCLDAKEQHSQALSLCESALELADKYRESFDSSEHARLLHVLARSQLAEEHLNEAKNAIERSCALLNLTADSLLRAELSTMQFSPQTPQFMVAYTMHLLGTLHRIEHRLDQSQQCFIKAMMLKLRVYGHGHPSTQTTAIFLAEIMLNRGVESIGESGIKEADELLRAAHKTLSAELGPTHELTLYCKQDMAEAAWHMKRFDEAVQMAESVYKETAAAYGEKSPPALMALRRWAKMLQNNGMQEEAYDISLRREEALRETLGLDSYSTIEAMCDTALTALFLKHNSVATAKAAEAIRLVETSPRYGPTHQFLAYPLDVLARCKYMDNKLDEAVALFERRLKMCKETDPDYHTTLQSISVIYETQGRYDEAEAIYQRTIQQLSHEDTLKDSITSSDLAFAHAGLSEIFNKRGNYVEAEAEARLALELYETSFPPGNPIIGATIEKLARCIASQSRFDEAEKLAEKALDILLKSLGENAGEVQDCRQLLQAIAENRNLASEAPFARTWLTGSQGSGQSGGWPARKPKRARRARDSSSQTTFILTSAVAIVAVIISGVAAVFFARAVRQSLRERK